MKDSLLVMSQQQNRQRERERIQRERDRGDRNNGLAGGATSLFGEPIKQRHEDETTKKIKSTLGDFDSVQRMLVSDPKHLIGISTSEISRIKGNKAKIEQILSEMRAFSPITGLEDVDQEADEVRLPQLTRDDLTGHTLSDDENSRPHRPSKNSLSHGNSNNLPSANNYHSPPANKPRISFNGSGQNRKGDSITCSSPSSSSSSGSSDSDSESGSTGSASSSGDASVNDDQPPHTDERKSCDPASIKDFHGNSGTFHRSRQASVSQPKESSPTVPSWKLSSFVPPSLQEKKVQNHISTSEKSGPKMNSVSQIIEAVVKGRGNSISPSLSSPSISSDSPASSRHAKKRKSSSPAPDTPPMDTAPRPKVPRKTGPVIKEEPNRDSPPPSLPPPQGVPSSSSSSSTSTSTSHHRPSSKADPADSAANHNDHHHSHHHHLQQQPHHSHHSHHKSKASSSSSSSSSNVTQSRSLNDGHSRSSTSKSTSKSHHSSKRSNHKENLDEFPSSKSPQHIICSIALGHLRRIPNVSSKFESHCKEVTNVKESSKQHSSWPETTHSNLTSSASSEQVSSEYYLSKAKQIKHDADKETERTLQLCKYLEAGLYFILTGNAMEQQSKQNSSQDPEKVHFMYRETLQLIRHISTKFVKSRSSSSVEVPSTDHKLTALSFRCQSLLYLKLYKLKSSQVRDNQKIIQNQAPEVPSSQSSTSSISLPTHVYSVMQKQLFLYSYLSAAHDLWSQADYLMEKYPACKAFFVSLDEQVKPLSLHSTLDHLVKYVNTGLEVLK